MKRFLLLILALLPLLLAGEEASSWVTPEQLTQAAGLPLLPPEEGWTRGAFEKTMRRCGLVFQGTPTRRSTFLRNRKVFDIPATEMLVISDADDRVTLVDVIYPNKGDSAHSRNMRQQIKRAGLNLKKNLNRLLGESEREKFGARGLQNSASVWKYGKVRFLVELRREEYTILHVVYENGSGEEKTKASSKKERTIHRKDLAGNVRKKDSGDIWIENIPMVDQGPKGYCVPATVERILRYYGITQITMHQLADAGDTGKGGGTLVSHMNRAITPFRHRYDLDMRSCGEVRVSSLKRYIERGIPVMWVMYVNPGAVQFWTLSRQRRPLARSPQEWLKAARKYRFPSGGGAHMCLIVGCNEKTDEIAISNSWGDREIVPAWIPVRFAVRISQRSTYALIPRK